MVIRRVSTSNKVSYRHNATTRPKHSQPIHPYRGQILDVQGDERASETVAHVPHAGILQLVLQLARESVGLPLKVSAYGVEANAHDGLHGREDHLNVI